MCVGGGGGLGGQAPTPFGGPQNFIKREKDMGVNIIIVTCAFS